MTVKIGRFLLGLLLIPFCVSATQTVVSLIQCIRPLAAAAVPPAAWALGGGFLVCLLLYLLLPRPVRTYVLAHELTHALWGALLGAKVSRLRVSEEGGSVTLSKSNFLITLAPYFFPLYTVLVVLGYYVASVFVSIEAYYLYWLAWVGFTWGFHLTFTVSTLLRRQSDIQEYGRLFSYGVIYLFNALGIALWIVIVSSATLEQAVEFMTQHTGELAVGIQAMVVEFRQ